MTCYKLILNQRWGDSPRRGSEKTFQDEQLWSDIFELSRAQDKKNPKLVEISKKIYFPKHLREGDVLPLVKVTKNRSAKYAFLVVVKIQDESCTYLPVETDSLADMWVREKRLELDEPELSNLSIKGEITVEVSCSGHGEYFSRPKLNFEIPKSWWEANGLELRKEVSKALKKGLKVTISSR